MRIAVLFLTLAFIANVPLVAEESNDGTGVQSQQIESSWEKPSHINKGEVSPAAAIASGDLPRGEKIDIVELRRTSGDTVTLKFKVHNTSNDELSLGTFGDGDWYNWNLAKVHLLDLTNKKKYFVLRDSESQPLTSKGKTKLKPGEQLTLWAKFPAPPSSVTAITVEIPEALPFEDLPIGN